jgi:uncharacterized protein YbaR (Trm112 family)
MFVELVDLLRCPRPHEDSWLVAAAEATAGRHIVRGTIGCPVCQAEYPIRDGVVLFGDAVSGEAVSGHAEAPLPRWDDGERAAEGMRLAALLDLSTPGGTVVLGGAWQLCADALLALADVRVLLVDPPRAPDLRDEVSAVRGAALPVAPDALRGVALDGGTATPERLTAAARALRPRGRLLAPAAAPLPGGVTELARDGRHWVAEREPAPPRLVPIARG